MYEHVRNPVTMPTYVAIITARFPESVEDELGIFKARLRERRAFTLPQHDPVQDGTSLWLTAAIDAEASTPVAAVEQALRAFEADAHATIGDFDGLKLDVGEQDGMMMRKFY
jgi:hypothetical protein